VETFIEAVSDYVGEVSECYRLLLYTNKCVTPL